MVILDLAGNSYIPVWESVVKIAAGQSANVRVSFNGSDSAILINGIRSDVYRIGGNQSALKEYVDLSRIELPDSGIVSIGSAINGAFYTFKGLLSNLVDANGGLYGINDTEYNLIMPNNDTMLLTAQDLDVFDNSASQIDLIPFGSANGVLCDFNIITEATGGTDTGGTDTGGTDTGGTDTGGTDTGGTDTGGTDTGGTDTGGTDTGGTDTGGTDTGGTDTGGTDTGGTDTGGTDTGVQIQAVQIQADRYRRQIQAAQIQAAQIQAAQIQAYRYRRHRYRRHRYRRHRYRRHRYRRHRYRRYRYRRYRYRRYRYRRYRGIN